MSTEMAIYVVYAKYLKRYTRGCMSICMPDIKSLAPTIQQGALNTYFTYITEQICLPHFKCSSHGKHTIGAYIPSVFAWLCQNTTKRNFHLTCYCKMCARNIYAHQIGHICVILEVHFCIMYVEVYFSFCCVMLNTRTFVLVFNITQQNEKYTSAY